MTLKLSLIALTALLPLSAFADDHFTLKDGSSFKGKIIQELDDSLIIEVAHSASIKEEREVKRDDILLVVEAKKDQGAYDAIKGLVPTADGLSKTDYQKMLNTKVLPFIRKYPTSKHFDKVAKMRDILTEEMERVDAGEMRAGGTWFSKEQQTNDLVEIDAQIAYKKAVKLAKGGRYADALNELHLFNGPYYSSSVGEKARDAQEEVLAAYKKRLDKDLAAIDSLLDEQKEKLMRLPENQRRTTMEQQKAQEKRYNALIKKQRKLRRERPWLSTSPLYKKPMQANLRNIESFQRKLAAKKPNTFTRDFKHANALIEEGSLKEAKKVVDRMRSIRAGKKYYEIVRDRYDDAALAEKEVKAEKRAAQKAERMEAAEAKKAAAEAKRAAAAKERRKK